MKIFKNNSPLWTAILVAALLFLIVQNVYVDHNYVKQHNQIDFPENKTVFFTVKEHQFSIRKKGFDTLTDSLKLWEYDKEKDIVFLREESLMPTQYTPLQVIYDNGNDSFEKQENIVPISSFPFSLKDAGSSFKVNQVESNGKVFFQYRDKELSLEPGDTYRLPYFDGFQLKSVVIVNHGLFDLKQYRAKKTGNYIKMLDPKHIEIKTGPNDDEKEIITVGDLKIPKLKKGTQIEYSFYKEKTKDGSINRVLSEIIIIKKENEKK